jgi:hypothetical protein
VLDLTIGNGFGSLDEIGYELRRIGGFLVLAVDDHLTIPKKLGAML